MEIEMLALAGVVGYVIGDTLSPVRRSVVTALASMERAVNQDVNSGDRKGED